MRCPAFRFPSFSFLTKRRYIDANPAADLELPKLGRPLPKGVMNEDEIDKVFEQVDLAKPTGVRDLAIMHVAYATGLRRSEVCNLGLNSIDRHRGVTRYYYYETTRCWARAGTPTASRWLRETPSGAPPS